MIAAPGRMLPQVLQPVRRVDPQREAVRRRPVEVHLADGRGPVIQVAEPLAHGECLVGEPGRELRHPDGMRELSRDQRLPARRAERRVAVGPLEEHPFRASASRLGVARRGSPSIPSVPPAWSSAMISSRLGRSTGFGRVGSGPAACDRVAESSPSRVRDRASTGANESDRVRRVGAVWHMRSRSGRQAGSATPIVKVRSSDDITSMPGSGAPRRCGSPARRR